MRTSLRWLLAVALLAVVFVACDDVIGNDDGQGEPIVADLVLSNEPNPTQPAAVGGLMFTVHTSEDVEIVPAAHIDTMFTAPVAEGLRVILLDNSIAPGLIGQLSARRGAVDSIVVDQVVAANAYYYDIDLVD